MKMMIRFCLAISLLLGLGCSRGEPPAAPERSTAIPAGTPEEFFALYVKLEHAFDPAVADLYADNAIIRNTRSYPDGQQRTLTIPAPKYKTLIRESMPLAKYRGDTSSYQNPTFRKEGARVRISANRHSNLKNYDSPISILIAKDRSGRWLIVEELSHSQP